MDASGDYYFINLDGDGIPEIYWASDAGAIGDWLIYYSDGEVKEGDVGNYGSNQYIEGRGLFLGSGGRQGSYYDTVYLLNNGELQILGDGSFQIKAEYYDADWEDWMFDYEWNGQTVTEEEYNVRLNEIFDTSAATSCNYYDRTDYDTILLVLQGIIAGN